MADNERRSELLRFALVGALGLAVDILTIHLLLQSGLGVYAARAVSYLCAATLTWAVNRRFTFAYVGAPSLREWLRYLVANSLGGTINYGLSTQLATSWDLVTLAVSVGSAAGFLVNYAASSCFVFHRS